MLTKKLRRLPLMQIQFAIELATVLVEIAHHIALLPLSLLLKISS
jgi:hypothetical protein